MRSPRSVVCAPIGMPSRSLNCAMDLRALVTSGFWPVMAVRSRISALDELGVLGGVADTHVDDDLDHAGHLHDVLVAELLVQLALDLVGVALLETRLSPLPDGRVIGHLTGPCPSAPQRGYGRSSSRPSRSTFSTRVLIRVRLLGLAGRPPPRCSRGSGPRWSTRPPVRVPRAVWPALVCLVTRWTPSTSTRWVSVYTAMTLPCLRLVLAGETTWTRSPFLIFIFAAMVRAPPAPAR